MFYRAQKIRAIYSAILLAAWLLAPISSLATGTITMEEKHKIPAYLFSWTTQEKLVKMDARNPNRAHMPLKPIRDVHGIALQWPSLSLPGQPGVFAWTNPVGAMKYTSIGDVVTNTNEYYAGIPGKDTPALLVMVPKRDAKVVTMRTSYRNLGAANKLDLVNQGDLIFHEVLNPDGSVRFHEWIVRNPAAIETYTADPRKLPQKVKNYLKAAAEKEFRIRENELFHPVDSFGAYERERINAFLASDPESIPETFRGDLALAPEFRCSREFGRIRRGPRSPL